MSGHTIIHLPEKQTITAQGGITIRETVQFASLQLYPGLGVLVMTGIAEGGLKVGLAIDAATCEVDGGWFVLAGEYIRDYAEKGTQE